MRRAWVLGLLLLGCHTAELTGWPPPTRPAEPRARALLERMWAAIGAEPSYHTHGELRFTVRELQPGERAREHTFAWDRYRNWLRWEAAVEGGFLVLRTDLARHSGVGFGAARVGRPVHDSTSFLRGCAEAGACKPGRQTMPINLLHPPPAMTDQALPQELAFQKLARSEFAHVEPIARAEFARARHLLLGPLHLCEPGIEVTVAELPAALAPACTSLVEPGEAVDLGALTALSARAPDGRTEWWLVDPATALPQALIEPGAAWRLSGWQRIDGGLTLPLRARSRERVLDFSRISLKQQPDESLYFVAFGG
jgi:hypothetical protein